MTELALPAGSLQSALAAFEHGADAVYLGLQQFSARKGAVNFSFSDLAKLKGCLPPGKKFYVTVNTLVSDHELADVEALLRQIAYFEPDGAIVQDLGIANIIAERFSGTIPLHGSTQLAAHTAAGVRTMQSMGFSRVVLSRELTLPEIAAIRSECPDIELKVFIHGALCYGFSGLCMASHVITGRSANRGECAQICRSWFTLAPGQRDGYLFSMTDLDIGQTVRELHRIGIDSLKIEGRMKSPAYVAATARYYRMLLDGETDEHAIEQARLEAHTIFSRSSSGGWLASYGRVAREDRNGPDLVASRYPGHIGVPIGQVTAMRSTAAQAIAEVELDEPIELYDGLMALHRNARGIDEAEKFGVHAMWDHNGKKLYTSGQHNRIMLEVPATTIRSGDVLYRISSHDQNLAEIPPGALPAYRKAIDIHVEIGTDALQFSTVLAGSGLPETTMHKTFAVEVQRAKAKQDTRRNLSKLFMESGDSLFTLGQLTISTTGTIPLEEVFLPLSQLKEARRAWYGALDSVMFNWFSGSTKQRNRPLPTNRRTVALPERTAISPPTANGAFLWIEPADILKGLAGSKALEDLLAMVDGTVYLPLAPVMFNESAYLQSLDKLILLVSDRLGRDSIRVGLNNIGQLEWAARHADIACFADVYLYMTNREAAGLLCNRLPNLTGMYHWIERPMDGCIDWPCAPTAAGSGFTPPLFISRSCFRYDSLGLSCELCPRSGQWEVSQNGKRYRVEVRNCLTVVSALN